MSDLARVQTTDSIKQAGRNPDLGFPRGHVGHLTPQQEAALEQLRTLCEEAGLYRRASADSSPSHSDTTLLRFLRARRYQPNEALQQFKSTEEWRKDNQISHLYDTADIAHYEEARRLYPQWTGRRDKRGMPIYLFEIAPLNSKRMAAYAKSSEAAEATEDKQGSPNSRKRTPARLRRLFALYENLLEFVLPVCSELSDRPNPETPISQSNNIVDISGVGLKQFWNLRGHMQDASVLATAHYPETLDRIFIVGAPSFFPTVWSWIKRWFDPITVSKIFILSEDSALKTLSTYIDIENIPKKYGGTLPFESGMMPVLDETAMRALNRTRDQEWPQGPLRLQRIDNGLWNIIEVGSENGRKRRETIGTFSPQHDHKSPNALPKKSTEEHHAAFEKNQTLRPEISDSGLPTSNLDLPPQNTSSPSAVPLAAITTGLPTTNSEDDRKPPSPKIG